MDGVDAEVFFSAVDFTSGMTADFARNFLLRYWPLMFAFAGVGVGVFVYRQFVSVPRDLNVSSFPDDVARHARHAMSGLGWFNNETEDPAWPQSKSVGYGTRSEEI